jgi:hypothetical protein
VCLNFVISIPLSKTYFPFLSSTFYYFIFPVTAVCPIYSFPFMWPLWQNSASNANSASPLYVNYVHLLLLVSVRGVNTDWFTNQLNNTRLIFMGCEVEENWICGHPLEAGSILFSHFF